MSNLLLGCLKTINMAPPLPVDKAKALVNDVLNNLTNLRVYHRSIIATDRSLLFLGAQEGKKYVGVVSTETDMGKRFEGCKVPSVIDGINVHVKVAPTNYRNAANLREVLPFLKARTIGLNKSAGCGDRLGMATPGHIRAIRKTGMAPLFAQQSVRENARTGRAPQVVIDDAMWGVFQEGWREGFGADADHLKTTADIDDFAAAGYTFYTLDPGDHVDDTANNASLEMLQGKVEALPWNELESTAADLRRSLAGKPIDLNDFRITITQEELLRAAAKYGKVIAYTTNMYRYLDEVMDHRPFELEMSVDETETITSTAEHVYIASELKRLGVTWVSLAPRYTGRFEKGVDYIGDLEEFEQTFAQHTAVAKTFGPYKLSIHSGSDKFSIYPIAARLSGELTHLKTAGTSYLEALRTVSRFDPDLFRKIVLFAIDCYPVDRASYHVSAEISKIPEITSLKDEALQGLLENFHAREVLHVTYGSVINNSQFRNPFFDTLHSHEEAYAQVLETHFDKHFRPFE